MMILPKKEKSQKKINSKKYNYNYTNNHNEIFPFVKSDTSETDSTLLNIVSENKNL